MSKTTITICGEECVILPAPKGAFILDDGFVRPEFVPYIAVAIDPVRLGASRREEASIYPLSHIEDNDYVEWYKSEILLTFVYDEVLDTLYEENIKAGNEAKYTLIKLYQEFVSHDTPMDDTAIEWFREKFKEYNITKADFDVFA